MKKLFLLLPLLLLAWCTMPWISLDRWDGKVDYFEKDALCQNYIESIKNDVTRWDNEYSSHNWFSAFYSPTLDQCVVSYSEHYNTFQEWYEEYSTYSYQSADKKSFCTFKYWSVESRVLCTSDMFYDKSIESITDEITNMTYVGIEKWPKDDTILNHLDQEEKYLKWLRKSVDERAEELLK